MKKAILLALLISLSTIAGPNNSSFADDYQMGLLVFTELSSTQLTVTFNNNTSTLSNVADNRWSWGIPTHSGMFIGGVGVPGVNWTEPEDSTLYSFEF